jgi:hypothetical protein
MKKLVMEKKFICDCSCHQEDTKVVYCLKCPLCDQRIKLGYMKEHLKECFPNLAIDALDAKWQAALTSAKSEYYNLLLSLIDDIAAKPSKFVQDFLVKCGGKNKNHFTGHILVGEVYNVPGITLVIEFKNMDQIVRLEIWFNVSVAILCAFIL